MENVHFNDYEINVAMNDGLDWQNKTSYRHLFATDARSCRTRADVERVFAEINARFPSPEFNISIKGRSEVFYPITPDEITTCSSEQETKKPEPSMFQLWFNKVHTGYGSFHTSLMETFIKAAQDNRKTLIKAFPDVFNTEDYKLDF